MQPIFEESIEKPRFFIEENNEYSNNNEYDNI